MDNLKQYYFKVVCERISPFGKYIVEDANFATIEEVHEFVKYHLKRYPDAKWELYMFPKML